MRVSFPYEGVAPLDVPDANLMSVTRPARAAREMPVPTMVESALANPIGSPRLASLAGPGDRVLLLFDDYTRLTPLAEMLPPILAELEAGGVRRDDVSFLAAPGTHRPMSEQELVQKLGEDVLRQYPVRQHDWRAESELARAGETPSGLPIVVNRHLLEADLVVGLGHIVPHRVTGFSGGAKVVNPGVAGAPPNDREMHWLAAQFPGREILGVVENPIRAEIDEMGRQVGLRYIVNAVQGSEGRLVGVFAGDPVAAHRRGARVARDVYGAHLPSLADIVVVDSYPADVDFWQAGKAVYASELAVRPGGVVILVTPAPEGVAGHHPAVLEFGVRPVAEIQRLVEAGAIKDVIAAAIMALTAWVVKERASGIMVSPGISAAEKERLGFAHASTPQEALDMAFQRLGRGAQVAVLHHSGEALPLAPAEAKAPAVGAAGPQASADEEVALPRPAARS